MHLAANICLEEGRQGFNPEQKRAIPSPVLCCHAQVHCAWVCLSVGAESYHAVPGLTVFSVFPKTCCPCLCAPRNTLVSITTNPIPPEFPLALCKATCQSVLTSPSPQPGPSRRPVPVPTQTPALSICVSQEGKEGNGDSVNVNKSRASLSHSDLGTVRISSSTALSRFLEACSETRKSAVNWLVVMFSQ